MESSELPKRHIVALVSTISGREQLLLERSLRSVLAQTRLPDLLVVVFDQDPGDAIEAIKARVAVLVAGRIPIRLLRNCRTQRRASGSWNTGIDHIFRASEYADHPDQVFVALLDDDDAWIPDHLETCLGATVASNLNVAVTGIIRHESEEDRGRQQSIPVTLEASELFIRGQHIQASNMFVRLDLLLLVGGFDEQLRSCTDRDLCIRLARHPDTRFGAVAKHTVHHFADPRPDRLSHPGSEPKLEGLSRFFEKYRDQFDAEAVDAAEERASHLFGWDRRSSESAAQRLAPSPKSSQLVPVEDIRLVIGFVTDSCVPQHVGGLLSDCLELSRVRAISSLDVVVLENGPIDECGSLRVLIEQYRRDGLRVWLIDASMQGIDAREFLPPDLEPGSSRVPIPVTRSLLALFVARIASHRLGAWAWILDDDKRLSPLMSTDRDTTTCVPNVDLGELVRLKRSGVDVVLGPDTDAAPLPLFATVRCQLVDLVAFVRATMAHDLADPLPSRRETNRRLRDRLRDFHHDLARASTEHLECPFHVEAERDGETRREAFVRIASRAERILAGEALTRPLILEGERGSAGNVFPSIRRGGSALFFDPSHLLRFPNSLASVGGEYVRRSDMLVSWLMREMDGLQIVESWSIATRHDRSALSPRGFDADRLREDIVGFALYSALEDLSAREVEGAKVVGADMGLSPEQLAFIGRTSKKYVTERTAVVTESIWRVMGLAKELLVLAREFSHSKRDEEDEALANALHDLEYLANRLLLEYTPTQAAEFSKRIRSIREQDFTKSIEEMAIGTVKYRAVGKRAWSWPAEMEAQRVASSRSRVEELFAPVNLEFVGSGQEGVVFADGALAFKVFDACSLETRTMLRQLVGRFSGARTLSEILEFRESGAEAILVRKFEVGEPYRGGHGESFVELLREARKLGLCFSNLNPKNLLVTSDGLKLIDYGRSVAAYSDAGFLAMAKRAWLSWRWHHRPDLSALMRASLHADDLPELDGFDRFLKAVNNENLSAAVVVLPFVESWFERVRPSSVLDYGCGRGVHAAMLAAAGARVTAFDPDARHRDRWVRIAAPNIEFTCDRSIALARGPFDGVVCSLVLCELSDGPEYERVLDDLRSSVESTGRVFITVCNSLFTFGGPTPLHRRRQLPPDASYEDTFSYLETIGSNGQPREEVHRPLSKLRRDLLRHGLVIDRIANDETVDLDRFEPASDFLVLECRPVSIDAPSREVTLLIRTCSMESETIEQQVEHLVTQLEEPRTFTERVLVVDSKSDEFLRQHAAADVEKHREACDRLVRRGLIDRVVVSPQHRVAIEAIALRWFGADCSATHTIANAPLASHVFGFESCRTELVLQVDADAMIARLDRSHDYLGAMIRVVDQDPRAVTVAFNIAHRENVPYTSMGRDPAGVVAPWRVESRASLVHLPRLFALRPLANEIVDGRFSLTWHRALDRAVVAGECNSYRGGDYRTFFIHPQNDIKRSGADWMGIISLIEDGRIPDAQYDHVDLVGSIDVWLPRDRTEEFVFVIAGRNVRPGRALRCLKSMLRQSELAGEFGAVIIDDGSDALTREFLRTIIPSLGRRITLWTPRQRRGSLANLVSAVESVCTNPESIIVTLDLDDALLTDQVLTRLAREFDRGADVSSGSMLRTDKHRVYTPEFENARARRGGHVWQHLRAFRKYLFDAVPRDALRDGDDFFDTATDWAYMLPIVELAEQPVGVPDSLYLYEPSGKGKGVDRACRESTIEKIVSKRPLRPVRSAGPGHVLTAEQLADRVAECRGGILIVRHAERPRFSNVPVGQRDSVSITPNGTLRAHELGTKLRGVETIYSSPVRRCVETGAAICSGLRDRLEVVPVPSLALLRGRNSEDYERLKKRLGWTGIMDAWIDGRIDSALLIPCEEVAAILLGDLLARIPESSDRLTVAVTHDFVITGLFAALRRSRAVRVPFLGGMLIGFAEARGFVSAGVSA